MPIAYHFSLVTIPAKFQFIVVFWGGVQQYGTFLMTKLFSSSGRCVLLGELVLDARADDIFHDDKNVSSYWSKKLTAIPVVARMGGRVLAPA